MALYQDPNSFFSLGKKDTYDLFIADNCSKKRNSCSNLGQNYEIPESADQVDSKLILTGVQYFLIKEMEVYSLKFVKQ